MKNRLSGCFTVLVTLLLLVSMMLNVIFVGAFSLGHHGPKTKDEASFEEEWVEGEQDASDKVAVVELSGIISSGIAGQFGDSMVDDIVAKLKQAREDQSVKAVILKIDSPGGEVNASDVIYHEVSKTRAVKPVVTYMESVAASGGYYSAMGSSYIMASDLSITASIGVILQTINYKDLLGKIGVKSLTFKSGKMKDMLNPARDTTPEEEQYVQSLINETYDKFVNIVAKERKLDVEALKHGIADGRIESGRQAKEDKLIDALGYFEDAITQAEKMGKTTHAKVIRYEAPFQLSKLFRFLGESSVNSLRGVNVQIGPEMMRLEPGKLYYISQHLYSGL